MSEHSCACVGGCGGVRQTLDELEFERGIWYAAQYGEQGRVRELMARGACADVRDRAGYTALHYAARNGHLSVCQFLLSRGADVNAVTRSGLATSLHRAASVGNYEMVKFLISNKANVRLKDADGKTALHRAAEGQHASIISALLQSCPDLQFEPDLRGKLPAHYVRQDPLKSLFA